MSSFIFFNNYLQSISYLNKFLEKQFTQVLISDNNLLFQEITSYENNIENSSVKNQELDVKAGSMIDQLPPKIDLLIIDSPHCKELITKYGLHKIKYIINLTALPANENNTEQEQEIFFKFPLKLVNFMKLINNLRADNFIFAVIKNNNIKSDIIYDEQKRCLKFVAIHDQQFHKAYLTEKENELFKYLLFHANMPIHKSQLQENIWKYNHNVESLTIETHLYRLKQKVPNNLIESSQNACKLVAAEIFI